MDLTRCAYIISELYVNCNSIAHACAKLVERVVKTGGESMLVSEHVLLQLICATVHLVTCEDSVCDFVSYR